MRKLLVLLTMAGLFLSAFPTLSFAQDATPVITEPESTPTEVVIEPTTVPTESAEQISTPAAEPNTSRSSDDNTLSANQMEPPAIYIDGKASNRSVPANMAVSISTEPGARLIYWRSETCLDPGMANHLDSQSLSASSNSKVTYAYQAQWRDSPDAPKSECLTVTWDDSETMDPPMLMINNSTENQRTFVGNFLQISWPTNTQLLEYEGATCEGMPVREVPGIEGGVGKTEADTFSYQLQWRDYPDDAAKSDCLSVEWYERGADEAPTLKIGNTTSSVMVPTGYRVDITTDSGATLIHFGNQDCTGPGTITGSSRRSATYNFPSSISYMAVWRDDLDGPTSKCLNITWEALENLEAPTLEIEGEELSTTVEINTAQELTTDEQALIYFYEDEACGEGQSAGQPSGYVAISDIPTVVSYKAKWNGFPDAPESSCFTITWKSPSKPAPTLTANGGTENVLLHVYTYVTLQTSDGAQISEHSEAGCTDPGIPYANNPVIIARTGNFTRYFQAKWPTDPDSPVSDCISVTWDFLNPPQLLVNGGTENVQVERGESVALSTNVGSTIIAYENEGCTGDSFDHYIFQIDVQSPDNHTVYYQSSWPLSDNAPKSDCLQVIWGEGSPVAPTLTLNGEASNATVDSGETVTFVTEDFAVLQVFETLDCSGTATSEVESGFAPSFDEATSISVRAVHKNDDTVTSECYVANWNAPAPPMETPTPTPTSPLETPTPTPTMSVETPTPTPTETPVTKTTSITVEMWDGSSIEGAVWNLYAPVASQSIADAYDTGTLGAENNAVLTDIPEGNYVFEVAPAGMDAQRWDITIGPDSEEIVLQFAQPDVPATPGATPPATTAPGEPTPAPTSATVSGLPDTGAGPSSSSTVLMLAGLLATGVMIAAIGRRRSAN